MTPAMNYVETASYPLVEASAAEASRVLSQLYPAARATTMKPRKKYLCAKCESRYDLHGLFEHMRNVHDGLLCQYCMKLFKRLGDLDQHLSTAHSLPPLYFSSAKRFNELTANQELYVVCAKCGQSVDARDLELHVCPAEVSGGENEFVCPLSNVAFNSKLELDLHISQGQGSLGMRDLLKNMGEESEPFVSKVAKVFQVLTGEQLALQGDSLGAKDLKKEKATNFLSSKNRFNFPVKKDAKTLKSKKPLLSMAVKVKPTKTLPAALSALKSSCSKSRQLSSSSVADQSLSAEVGAKNPEVQSNNALLPTNLDVDRVPPLKLRASLSDTLKSSLSKLHSEIRNGDASKSKKNAVEDGSEGTKETFEWPKLKTAKSIKLAGKAVETKKKLPEVTKTTPKKKESRSARMARLSDEINVCFSKLREVINKFKDSSSFCDQVSLVSIESTVLLNHIGVVHETKDCYPLGEPCEEAIARIRRFVKEKKHRDMIFTYEMNGQTVLNDVLQKGYKCCYCSKYFKGYDELFSHVEKEHNTKVLTCSLCQNIFLSYGSYISHVCYGPPSNFSAAPKAKFRCKLCNKQDLSSFFDFQVHLRKAHNVCDISFRAFDDQKSLAAHCSRYALERTCTKCLLTYDSELEFRRHLHYKHEAEQRTCNKCHQKTWPHVYHFCVKPQQVQCEVCELKFEDYKAYRVHFRTHTGAQPYLCSICGEAFISKTLLWKHHMKHHPELRVNAQKMLAEKRQKREALHYNASSYDVVSSVKHVLTALIAEACRRSEEKKAELLQQQNVIASKEKMDTSNETRSDEDKTALNAEASGKADEKATENGVDEEKGEETEDHHDPLAAAVASIMGPAGSFNVDQSPQKGSMSPDVSAQSSSAVFAQSKVGDISQLQSSVGDYDPPARPIRTIPPPGPLRRHNVRVPVPRSRMNVVTPRIMKPGMTRPQVRLEGVGNFTPTVTSTPLVTRNNGHHNHYNEHSYNGNYVNDKTDNTRSHMSGMWNQDLFMLTGGVNENEDSNENDGTKIDKSSNLGNSNNTNSVLKTNNTVKRVKTLNSGLVDNLGSWDLALSESSSDSDEETRKRKRVSGGRVRRQVALVDHDYCHAAFLISQEPITEDLTEMGKILSNVAMGLNVSMEAEEKSKDEKSLVVKKKKKKKRKKKRKERDEEKSSSSEADTESTSKPNTSSPKKSVFTKPSSKLKYHMPGAAGTPGITPFASRPFFSSSSDEEDKKADDEGLHSSDLDTDFEADELLANMKQIQVSSRRAKPSLKAVLANDPDNQDSDEDEAIGNESKKRSSKPSLKLKIKLPPPPTEPMKSHPSNGRARVVDTSRKRKSDTVHRRSSNFHSKSSRGSDLLPSSHPKSDHISAGVGKGLNGDYGMEGNFTIAHDEPPLRLAEVTENRRYCFCDRGEDQEMIACDGPKCEIEWFHFSCVGIEVPPLGKWFCPECRLEA